MKKKKDSIVAKGMENANRILMGAIGGDPEAPTTWVNTLVLILLILGGYLIWRFFTK